MFAWENPITGYESDKVDPANYTYEGDGLRLAFMESQQELADIDIMFAQVSTQGTNVYAKAYNKGGQQAAMEAITAFKGEPVFEGFLQKVKDKLVSLLKKLKEKIKAFFHSAIQYFDAFFKNGKEFANKYEDELNKKDDLDDFKYKMYQWNKGKKSLDKAEFKKEWDAFKKAATDKADSMAGAGLQYALESYYAGSSLDWIGACAKISRAAVMEASVWFKDRTYAVGDNPPEPTGWKKSSVDSDNASGDYFSRLEANGYTKYGTSNNGGNTGSGSGNDTGNGGSKEVKTITSAQKKEITAAIIKHLGGDANTIDRFKEKLKKELRGSAEEQEYKPDIKHIIDTLKDDGDKVQDVKDAGDALLSDLDELISKANDSDKSGDEMTKVKNGVAIFNICKSVYMEYFDTWKACIKERDEQYKHCLNAALHYKGKKD